MNNIEYKNDIGTLVCNSFDSTQKKRFPIGVYFPKTINEIKKTVSFFNKNKYNFLIRNAGSGFVGGAVPNENCFVISLEKFNKIIFINKEKKRALVQSGIINGELNKILKKDNLIFTPDPASKDFSSIGGNISNNSGGLNTRKFGVTRESVRGLTLIKPNGEIIKTGELHPNNENLILQHLIIGSEGTLFVIAEAMLSLETLDKTAESFIIYSKGRKNIFKIINKILSKGIVPETFEFIEKDIVNLLYKNKKLDNYQFIADKYISLIRYSGGNLFKIEKIVKSLGGKIKKFNTKKDGEAIWDIRRDISQTLYGVGKIKINEDISLPIDQLNNFFNAIDEFKLFFNIYSFGHAGDGNIHVNIMVNSIEEKNIAKEKLFNLFSLVIRLKGSITGEHGVGTSKKEYFSIEHSKNEIEIMIKIKRIIDKSSLLNRNKIFDI